MSNTTTEERVLVIPRVDFEANESFNGFRSLEGRSDLGEYLTAHPEEQNIGFFMTREAAESSEHHKQLLPYIVIMCGNRVLTYRRSPSGGEAKLHGKLSVGVGGHINSEDDPEEPFFAYMNGAVRELKEEIGLDVNRDTLQRTVIGLVNDEETPVGRVHLGVVHVIAVDEQQGLEIIKNTEHTMLDSAFVELESLAKDHYLDQMESWSAFVINHMASENSVKGKWNDLAFRERVGMLSICASRLASACTGFLIQDSQRSHNLSKAAVEQALGEVQCMMSGLLGNGDIRDEGVEKAAKDFYKQLPQIMRHQFVEDEPSS